MSGITISTKTDKRASLKLLNQINSFLFEEQYGELKNAPSIVTKRLKLAAKGLADVINKSKKK